MFSLDSLRPQHDMLMAAMNLKPELPALDQVFSEMLNESVSDISVQADVDYSAISETVDNVVENRMNGAVIIRSANGDEWGNIQTQ